MYQNTVSQLYFFGQTMMEVETLSNYRAALTGFLWMVVNTDKQYRNPASKTSKVLISSAKQRHSLVPS